MLNNVINSEKLEKILVAHWTEFMDVRELMSSASSVISNLEEKQCKVNKLTISRFELVEDGFIVWLECKVGDDSYTVELELGDSVIYHKPVKN